MNLSCVSMMIVSAHFQNLCFLANQIVLHAFNIAYECEPVESTITYQITQPGRLNRDRCQIPVRCNRIPSTCWSWAEK